MEVLWGIGGGILLYVVLFLASGVRTIILKKRSNQMEVWTATTEGNDCELTTTVHRTKEEAEQRVRDDLNDPANADLVYEQLALAWESEHDGLCIIKKHEL